MSRLPDMVCTKHRIPACEACRKVEKPHGPVSERLMRRFYGPSGYVSNEGGRHPAREEAMSASPAGELSYPCPECGTSDSVCPAPCARARTYAASLAAKLAEAERELDEYAKLLLDCYDTLERVNSIGGDSLRLMTKIDAARPT